MSYASQVPLAAARYFGTTYAGDHPVISQEFLPVRGWRRSASQHRVSHAWLRKLRAAGVSHVTLVSRGRSADFSVAELLREAQR